MHSTGNASRIDFIAVGGSVQRDGMISRVAREIDLLTPNPDHWCVQLDLVVKSQQPEGSTGRLCKPRYDRHKTTSDEGKQILIQEFEKKPRGTWDMHPDMHAELLEDDIKEILSEHFVKSPDGPRALYAKKEVWRMRALTLDVKKKHRKKKQGLAQLIAGAAFQTWKMGTGLLPRLIRRMSINWESLSVLLLASATPGLKQGSGQTKRKQWESS